MPASAQTTEPDVERVVITLDPLSFTGTTNEDEGQKLWNELMKYKFWGTDSMRTKDDFRVEEASGYTGTAKGGVFFEGENHTLGGPILSGKDLNLGSSKNDKFIKGPVYANDLKFADNWKSSWGQSFDGIYCFTGKVAINTPNENQNRSEYVNVLSGFVELVHREDLANGKKRGRVYADWGNNLTDAEKQRVNLDGPASDCPSGNNPDAVPRPETSLTVPVLTNDPNRSWKPGIYLKETFTEFVHVPPVSLDDVNNGTVWFDNYLESISLVQNGKTIYIVMPSSTQNCENSKDPVTNKCYKKTGRLTRIFVRDGIQIDGSASDAKIMVAYVNDDVVWKDGAWKYKDGDEYRNITKENIKVVPDTAYSIDRIVFAQLEELHVLHAFANLLLDFVAEIYVVLQEQASVLAALADAFVVVAEPGTALLDDIQFAGEVEDGRFARNSRTVQNVEFALGERGGDLVLHDFHGVLFGATENQCKRALHAAGCRNRCVRACGVAVVIKFDAVLFALEFHAVGEGLVTLERFERIGNAHTQRLAGECCRSHVFELINAAYLAVGKVERQTVNRKHCAVNHGISVTGASPIGKAYGILCLSWAFACDLGGRFGVFQINARAFALLPTYQVRLGVAVFFDRFVPVQMFRRNAQNNAHVWRYGQRHQLETRQFQDADAVRSLVFEQVQCRHAEVSANGVRLAALVQNVANHAHCRALAECSRDAHCCFRLSLF